MGFLRRGGDEPEGERFLMRETLLAIGDDYWIENEQGERTYKVNGKALRMRQTFVLENASGDEVARIQERKLSVRDKIAIERHGDKVATVHKALVGIRAVEIHSNVTYASRDVAQCVRRCFRAGGPRSTQGQ